MSNSNDKDRYPNIITQNRKGLLNNDFSFETSNTNIEYAARFCDPPESGIETDLGKLDKIFFQGKFFQDHVVLL